MEQVDQVGGSFNGGVPQSTSCFCLDSSHPLGGEVNRVRGVGAVSKAGWRSNVSRNRNLLKGKTAGLFGAVVAVASSLVVVMGLVSTPMASAAPYQTHAVGGATKSSLVSPHTPTDSAAPLNLVVSETYLGDAAPIVTQSTPSPPTLSNNGLGLNSLASTWNVSSYVDLNGKFSDRGRSDIRRRHRRRCNGRRCHCEGRGLSMWSC